MNFEDVKVKETYALDPCYLGSRGATFRVTGKGEQYFLGKITTPGIPERSSETSMEACYLSPILPKRWEFVRFDFPREGEFYVSPTDGTPSRAAYSFMNTKQVIIKEIV